MSASEYQDAVCEQNTPPRPILNALNPTPARAVKLAKMLGALKDTPQKPGLVMLSPEPESAPALVLAPALESPARCFKQPVFARAEYAKVESDQFRGIIVVQADGREELITYPSDKPMLSWRLPGRDFTQHPKMSYRKMPALEPDSQFLKEMNFFMSPKIDHASSGENLYIPLVQAVTLKYANLVHLQAERAMRLASGKSLRYPASQKGVTGVSARECVIDAGLKEIFGDGVVKLNLCHVLAHGLVGDIAQDAKNLLVGTATANADMLKMETLIPSVLKRAYVEGDVDASVTLNISVCPYPGYEDIRLAKSVRYEASFHIHHTTKMIVMYFDMLKAQTGEHGISAREFQWHYDQFHVVCFDSSAPLQLPVQVAPICPQAERAHKMSPCKRKVEKKELPSEERSAKHKKLRF